MRGRETPRLSWERVRRCEAIKTEPPSPSAASRLAVDSHHCFRIHIAACMGLFASSSFFSSFFLLCFSNPPCASLCLNFMFWFNFRGYPRYETCGGLARVGYGKIPIWSKLVLQWFWEYYTAVWWNAWEEYMASALMGFGCLIKHVKIQRKKGLVGKCNSFILKDLITAYIQKARSWPTLYVSLRFTLTNNYITFCIFEC